MTWKVEQKQKGGPPSNAFLTTSSHLSLSLSCLEQDKHFASLPPVVCSGPQDVSFSPRIRVCIQDETLKQVVPRIVSASLSLSLSPLPSVEQSSHFGAVS